jgi:hypothetical protein
MIDVNVTKILRNISSDDGKLCLPIHAACAVVKDGHENKQCLQNTEEERRRRWEDERKKKKDVVFSRQTGTPNSLATTNALPVKKKEEENGELIPCARYMPLALYVLC